VRGRCRRLVAPAIVFCSQQYGSDQGRAPLLRARRCRAKRDARRRLDEPRPHEGTDIALPERHRSSIAYEFLFDARAYEIIVKNSAGSPTSLASVSTWRGLFADIFEARVRATVRARWRTTPEWRNRVRLPTDRSTASRESTDLFFCSRATRRTKRAVELESEHWRTHRVTIAVHCNVDNPPFDPNPAEAIRGQYATRVCAATNGSVAAIETLQQRVNEVLLCRACRYQQLVTTRAGPTRSASRVFGLCLSRRSHHGDGES